MAAELLLPDLITQSETRNTALVQNLLTMAPQGLSAAYNSETQQFAQTVRGVRGQRVVELQREGSNVRYAAIAALGLQRLDIGGQKRILHGLSAAELSALLPERSLTSADSGAVALAAWAAAEVAGIYAARSFARLTDLLHSGKPVPTVDVSWILTAALAGSALGDTSRLRDVARDRLLSDTGPHCVFPHVLPAQDQATWRQHVSCFADQVYPIQALARLFRATGDQQALDVARRCADRICASQGAAGQWWWHYDTRTGGVVERYPVYSVHQHAMAPMALIELDEVSGSDHTYYVNRGLSWLEDHPEVIEELVSERHGLVWRKVGRREPLKAARALSAAATSRFPSHQLHGLDRVFPPTKVDYECRPYELGWLLYTWLPQRLALTTIRKPAT